MRAIDGDALRANFPEPKDWRDPEQALVHITGIWAEIDNAPTIELRCEECEAFNKTRLLVPQPERKKGKYTKEELTIFAHGISLSLLSKRSAQHWHYDDDTAKEIEFLETLYKKVQADMREDSP